MSVPKYIKELSRFQKRLKLVLLFAILISLIIWIAHIYISNPSNVIIILLYPEIYIFWVALFGYCYLYIKSWKERIYYAENDIYETIAYRSKTSIRSISNVKNVSEKDVKSIIQRLINQEKLFGTIKDDLFISERPMTPICSLCNKDITDRLFMFLCPFCKRPYHKDHIIDYINEYKGQCPNCKRHLELSDIIK